MKRCFLFVILLFSVVVVAQKPSASSDFVFANYLIGSSLKDEAVLLLRERPSDGDSISFMKGYAYYSTQQLDSAIRHLTDVCNRSALYNESRFYAALSAAHKGAYVEAENILSDLPLVADSSLQTLRHFELCGLNLLQRDYAQFDMNYALLDINDYRYSDEAAALQRIRNEFGRHRKSPLLAACLSMVVPGLGKVYAGNIGEGVASFLTIGSLTAITAENVSKAGWNNWKTILFGGLATVFYIGNIYGSAVSVRVSMENFEQQQDVQILYNIHIPIRNNFRR